MGGVCCCLPVENFEEYVNPIGFGCFVQSFVNVCTTLFQRRGMHAVPLSIQGATSLNSTAPLDNSLADMYNSPPRPLPYDMDSRCFHLQRDGVVSRNDIDASLETLIVGEKCHGYDCEGGSKECRSESSLKLPLIKLTSGIGYVYSSSEDEDEDECPTCLEEYSPENPKIVAQCFHHFHLGCIYAWMERSETCPVCGKMMVFDETH